MSYVDDIAIRFQVYLERLKSGEFRDFNTVIQEIEKEVRAELASGELIDFSKVQMARVLARVRANVSALLRDTVADFEDRLKEFSGYAYEFEGMSLRAVLGTVAITSSKIDAVWKSVRERPMSATGDLLLPWINKMTAAEVTSVESLLRLAHAEGWSNRETTRALRGTRDNRFTDGLLSRLGRQNSTIVRTAMQHASSVSRQQMWEDNSDIFEEYRWVSVLDNKTSDKCRALDGKVFKLNEGPVPPIHPNCRSITVPVFPKDYDIFDVGATRQAQGGNVGLGTTYYEWLKTQSAEFQDSVIGPARGALLRNGGLTAAEFTRLQLNSIFEPLTLDEMRKLAPLAFKRAGI